MSVDLTARSSGSATHPDEIDTTLLPIDPDKFSIDWHRSAIHIRAQHGCPLCPEVACSCGYTGTCCPNHFEHRRSSAGSETTWRKQAVA